MAWRAVPRLDEVRVQVDNGTDIPIAIYVDGVWRGTNQPGATIVVPIGEDLRPITVEARSPNDAMLATLDVPLGPMKALLDREGDAWGAEFAVPCGGIRIFVGELDRMRWWHRLPRSRRVPAREGIGGPPPSTLRA